MTPEQISAELQAALTQENADATSHASAVTLASGATVSLTVSLTVPAPVVSTDTSETASADAAVQG